MRLARCLWTLCKLLTRAPAGVAAFLLAVSVVSFPLEASARKYASLVIDAESGEVLHARHADTKRFPASLTKMMTLYMVFEALDQGRLTLDQRLHVSRRAASMPPSKLGLRRGQSIRVKDAILALVTKSANDVAVVVAEALGKTESQFAQKMTRKAWELGLSKTRFRNASGLPNKRQITTARDMAKLARALLRHYPQYYDYFSTTRFSYRGRTYRNHNKLLTSYSGTDGIKTGYIRASGYNLVASTVREGRRLIAVVFGGKSGRSRNRHMAKLLDKGFATPRKAYVRKMPPVPARKPGGAPELSPEFVPTVAPQIASSSEAKQPPRAEIEVVTLRPPKRKPADRENTQKYQFAPVATPGNEKLPPPSVKIQVTRGKPAQETAAKTTVTSSKQDDKKLNKPFGIQVGAYYKYVRAEQAATSAARRVSGLLDDAHVWIPQRRGARGKIFQSRLMGLTKLEARNACKALEQARVDCMVIRLQKGISTAFLGPRVGDAIAN